MEPCFIDLLETPHFLVSGDIQSGKTTFLQALAVTLALKFSPESWTYTFLTQALWGFMR